MKVPETVRVCECGVVAADWAGARCGKNRQHNMRATCPTRRVRIVAFEMVDDDPESGATGGTVNDSVTVRNDRPHGHEQEPTDAD